MNRFFGEKRPLYLEQLKENGYTPPSIASVIENGCSKSDKFSELIREELYRDFPFFPEGVNDKNRDEFIQFITENNSTMRTIGALCCVKDKEKGKYFPNRRIHRVVNFNLEAVLKAHSQHRYNTRILRTIEHPSSKNVPSQINIYDMHGYLRFDTRYRAIEQKKRMGTRVLWVSQFSEIPE